MGDGRFRRCRKINLRPLYLLRTENIHIRFVFCRFSRTMWPLIKTCGAIRWRRMANVAQLDGGNKTAFGDARGKRFRLRTNCVSSPGAQAIFSRGAPEEDGFHVSEYQPKTRRINLCLVVRIVSVMRPDPVRHHLCLVMGPLPCPRP